MGEIEKFQAKLDSLPILKEKLDFSKPGQLTAFLKAAAQLNEGINSEKFNREADERMEQIVLNTISQLENSPRTAKTEKELAKTKKLLEKMRKTKAKQAEIATELKKFKKKHSNLS
jgi:hypothetical protein